jgi:hypothetical protein
MSYVFYFLHPFSSLSFIPLFLFSITWLLPFSSSYILFFSLFLNFSYCLLPRCLRLFVKFTDILIYLRIYLSCFKVLYILLFFSFFVWQYLQFYLLTVRWRYIFSHTYWKLTELRDKTVPWLKTEPDEMCLGAPVMRESNGMPASPFPCV